jgi:hypothetical protein
MPTLKYEPLAEHLASLPSMQKRVVLSFQKIESILGAALPASARRYEEWWIGGRRWTRVENSQVQERAWHGVGWSVEDVDPKLGLVTFRRQG